MVSHSVSQGMIRLHCTRALVYILGLVPAGWDIYLGAVGALGPEPINALERNLGLWAIRFLLASLALTPLRRLLAIDLLRYRRAVGLLAFYYASLHLCAYLSLDHDFNWSEILADIVKRPYVSFGMATFVILVPLAITSNNAAIAWIGGKAWSTLHRLVYIAPAGAALHFLLLVKSWPVEPIAYAAATVGLLGFRLWKPRKTRRTKPAPAI